jgi:hypothetical protein
MVLVKPFNSPKILHTLNNTNSLERVLRPRPPPKFSLLAEAGHKYKFSRPLVEV